MLGLLRTSRLFERLDDRIPGPDQCGRHAPGDRKHDVQAFRCAEVLKYGKTPYDAQQTGAEDGQHGPEFETIFLKQDEYKVVLPKGHPLTECAVIEQHALDGQPFLLLEHGGRTEVSDFLTQFSIHPDIRFTTWEDYAILSMAEKGLGIGILPQMILQRIPYEVEIRPLSAPYYRRIGLAMKNRVRLSPAAKKFLEYLPFREAGADR